MHDVEELLGVYSCLNLTAASGATIQYKGCIKTKFRLNKEDSKEVTVPFLETAEQLEQPIVGYSVTKLLVKTDNDHSNSPAVIHSIATSLRNVGEVYATELVNLI